MTELRRSFLVLPFCLAMAACSGPEPTDQTHNGELTDDDPEVPDDHSRYDVYEFEAERGWAISLEMRSQHFATYLWLIGPNGNSLQQVTANDGNTSRLSFTAPESGDYVVRANSHDGSGRGAYTLRITARPPTAAPPPS
jgi:hypothetical protein